MSSISAQTISSLKGTIVPPGDKSISHRAIIISAIAKGKSRISNILDSLDCRSTADAFKKMGIAIDIQKNKTATVEGRGLRGLNEPPSILDMGNSGTTTRLLLGILAGQNFKATLTGDESLSKRPMRRITQPLMSMGAVIEGQDNANLLPITIKGQNLKPISYNSPIASAQVKSAIIFAGLYAKGITEVTEPCKSRDHTEKMLELFGVDIEDKGLSVSVKGMDNSELNPQTINVPGDISSAAFFVVLGLLAKNSEIKIASCGINPTRIGILNVLKRMGAKIELANIKKEYEPCADIIVRSSSLKATEISEQEIPLLIDEIPVISLCATQADGTTIIKGAGELRVKETDRIYSIVTNLKNAGADIKAEGDAIIIKGPAQLKGISCESFGDHRTAMMMLITGCIAKGKTTVNDTDCIKTSFPDFLDQLKSLT